VPVRSVLPVRPPTLPQMGGNDSGLTAGVACPRRREDSFEIKGLQTPSGDSGSKGMPMRGRKPDELPSTSAPSRRRVANGQALVIFALFSLVLLGALALAVDAGMLLAERRQDQSAADAAALAAGRAAVDIKSAAEVLATGQLYGAWNSRPGSTITINRPPTSGPYAGNNKYVEAVVTSAPPKFFVGAVYTGTWTVTARAVAGIEPVKRPYALLALHPPGIAINGGPTITISGAGSIMSNGNISNTGGSSIVT